VLLLLHSEPLQLLVNFERKHMRRCVARIMRREGWVSVTCPRIDGDALEKRRLRLRCAQSGGKLRQSFVRRDVPELVRCEEVSRYSASHCLKHRTDLVVRVVVVVVRSAR
tara:strand:+ start:186 stop:515 length:330 start_codon:yes stop_codon:yes gene_type:complete